MLGQPVLDPQGERIGHVVDLVARLHTGTYPQIRGVLADFGRREVFIPEPAINRWRTGPVSLDDGESTFSLFEPHADDVLLSAELLEYRLITLASAQFVYAVDLEFVVDGTEIRLCGVHTQVEGTLRRRLRRLAHHPGQRARYDWHDVEALVGHRRSVLVRASFARLRCLSAPQLAELIEHAQRHEHHELVQNVDSDPLFTVGVLDDRDNDPKTLESSRYIATRPDTFRPAPPTHTVRARSQLFGDTDAQIATRLARMRSSHAAHTMCHLAPHRRIPVINLLPAPVRRAVTALLEVDHPPTASELMCTEFLSLPADLPGAHARRHVRNVTPVFCPEALLAIYLHCHDGALSGALSPVAVMQADPVQPLTAIAEPDPIFVAPTAEKAELVWLMYQYRLSCLPVVDDQRHLLGVISRHTLDPDPHDSG